MVTVKGRLRFFIFAGIALGIAFGYGLATAHYDLFPYQLIKQLRSNKGNSLYYTRKKNFFERCGEQGDAVMIGDSLTDGAEWRELFPEFSIINRGINGDTAKGLVERMESIYSTKANKAFLMIGTNDFSQGATVSGVFETYEKIIRGLQAHDIKPYIQSTLIGWKNDKEHRRKVIELNQKLRELSCQEGFVFIDLNVIFASGEELSSDFSDDGVHLSGAGYLTWKNAIKQYLKK